MKEIDILLSESCEIHKQFQLISREFRLRFLEICKNGSLRRTFIRNEYTNRPMRSDYAVEAIWDDLTIDFIRIMTNKSKVDANFMRFAFFIMKKSLANSKIFQRHNSEEEKQYLDKILQELENDYCFFLSRKLNANQKLADSQDCREVVFMETMIEMKAKIQSEMTKDGDNNDEE